METVIIGLCGGIISGLLAAAIGWGLGNRVNAWIDAR